MLTEKQSTYRSPRRPVEVSYVSSDATELYGEGYQFNLPIRWTSQQSTNKMIGLRRLKYTPCAANLVFTISTIAESGDQQYPYDRPVSKYYTSQNTLEEIISDISDEVNISASVVFAFAYNGTTLSIDCMVDSVGTPVAITFESLFYANEFRKVFNQETLADGTEEYDYGGSEVYSLTFTNVWNRQDLYFHGSFSDSTRQIIGCNGDFWQEPSVFYSAMLNSNTFTLRFTQDTVTSILPRHGVLLVQFCLIFNCLRYLD